EADAHELREVFGGEVTVGSIQEQSRQGTRDVACFEWALTDPAAILRFLEAIEPLMDGIGVDRMSEQVHLVTPLLRLIDVARLAGIFDGEGSISITHRKASRPEYSDNFQVTINAAQLTAKSQILEDFRARFGGRVRPLKRQTYQNRNPVSEWHIIRRSL